MNDLFISTSAYPKADESLLKEARIGWVRQGFPVPYKDPKLTFMAPCTLFIKEPSFLIIFGKYS